MAGLTTKWKEPNMKKKEMFLMLVQTWVLAVGSRREPHTLLFKARFANATLALAMRITEGVIPNDVASACEHFCMWEDEYPGVGRPAWLPEF